MVFPIAGGNESKGYEISNSLRFNDDDSASLSFTPSGNPTDADKFTISCWIKLGNIGVNNAKIYDTGGSDDNNRFALQFQGTNSTLMTSNNSGVSIITSQVLRDPSAWYHVVAAIDSQNSTTNNKHIIYVNGVQADIGTNNLGSTSQVGAMTNGVAQYIGRNGGADNSHFDGYMTEFHLVDGQQLAPTDFGEFDDNGVWIPKKYTGTYGTNGFFLQFKQTGTSANASGIGADTSGNDHHWAVTNLAATDITEDTCTNNFCTWNPLNTAVGGYYTNTLLQGNLQCSSGGFGATFDMPSGKWYWEVRCNSSDADQAIGAMSVTESGQTSLAGDSNPTHGFLYQANGNARRNGTVEETWSTFTNGDIIGFSYDADNRILKGYKNNSLAGDITLTDSGDSYTPTVTALGGNFIANFGQEGSFAGTVTAQGNSDGKYGNFYYAPPSGYYALCTKRLAEFG